MGRVAASQLHWLRKYLHVVSHHVQLCLGRKV